MSGHNKWSKIKNKKAATDAVKSKIFSKMAKLISTASRQVKGDLTSPVLRTAIEKAREHNMPADNIDRAVKKGSGSGAEALEVIVYEAYGPEGVAMIIEVITSNRNKAAQEIKAILSRHNLSLAAPGSAVWAFKKESDPSDPVGIKWEPDTTAALSEEGKKILETLVEELENNDEVQSVYTNAI